MLSKQEREALDQHLFKRGILIPNSCVLLRLQDVLELLNVFTEEDTPKDK